MWRVTWRNLVARKVRLLLSATAIVLGVAFVSGSFVFTDAMSGAFTGIIRGSTADVEVAPRGSADFGAGPAARAIDDAVVRELRALPEAGGVHPYTQLQNLYVVGSTGKLVGGNGPPGLAFSDTETISLTGDPITTYVAGRPPRRVGEIALDVATAEKGGYALGDRVRLVSPGDPPRLRAELTGLVEFGAGSLGGATLVLFEPRAMQELFFGGRNVWSGVSLNTADGVTQTELRDAAAAVLPPGLTARTGNAVAESDEAGLQQVLGFLNTFLLVFAAIALVVGTFLIINTFSILVAQRSRELALLRAMGASRGQVNRSVLAEALIVGLLGGTLGLGVGYLLALGLRELFGLAGLDLSDAQFPVRPRTVLASYAVGVGVTMVAAYLPARRAARIPPVAAMRDDVALPETALHRRLLVGVAMVVVGAGLMVTGFALEGDTGLFLIGGGMLLVLVGVSLMSPVIGKPLVHGLGAAYRRLFGSVGQLAAQNALRNPRRTAATASALMLGLALVVLMAILGRSAQVSTDQAIDETLSSQLLVSSVANADFSPTIAEQIREVDGIASVAQFRQAFAETEQGGAFVGAGDPAQLGEALNFPMARGLLGILGPDSVVIDQATAERRGYAVGDTVRLQFQARTIPLTVAAVFPIPQALPANYLVTLETLERGGLQPLDTTLFLTKEPGADTAAIRTEVDRITRDLPTVTLQDPAEFAAEQRQQIDQFLYFIYALLGLAVVIAVLGIVNTLALSVIERTREIGLLRAVGLSRRQLRRMVRLESVIVAVLGAVLGVAMGVVFGVALQRAIADQGVDVLAIPWWQLGLFVLLAAGVGVLAAVVPARRAARLDVLRAISTE